MWDWNLPANGVKACYFLPHFLLRSYRSSYQHWVHWQSLWKLSARATPEKRPKLSSWKCPHQNKMVRNLSGNAKWKRNPRAVKTPFHACRLTCFDRMNSKQRHLVRPSVFRRISDVPWSHGDSAVVRESHYKWNQSKLKLRYMCQTVGHCPTHKIKAILRFSNFKDIFDFTT